MKSKIGKIDLLGTAAFFATMTAWGIVPIFLRSFIHEIDAWTANGVRYGISALFWSGPLILWIRSGAIRINHLLIAAPIVSINLIAQILWAWSPYFLEAGILAFLVRVACLFSVVASFIVFPRERILIRSSKFWIGLLFSLAGMIGMTYWGGNGPSGGNLIGFVVVIACGFFFALYGVAVRYFAADMQPHQAFSLICPATALPLIFLGFTWGDYSSLMAMSSWRIFLVLFSGLLGIAFAHVAYYTSLERLGVAIGSTANLLSPLVTASLAYPLLHETISSGQIIAGILMLIGGGFLVSAQTRMIHDSIPEKVEL